MAPRFIPIFLACWMLACTSGPIRTTQTVQQWHTFTLDFEGPLTGEQATPNPFTDYRLSVTFTHPDTTYQIRGFFAADGRAAETQADSGKIWRVHFTPDRTGTWTYRAQLLQGPQTALLPEAEPGTPLPLAQPDGTFEVMPSDKVGRDFRAHGRLYRAGTFYRFAGDGSYFLKGGADSPENLLAYEDFDATYRGEAQNREGEANVAEAIHRYEAHVSDWQPGDPVWQGSKGKGLIGGLNYLAAQGVNSMYFLTLNIGGDGRDVWPYTGYEVRDRFDCSKLDQWEMVFRHMERLGIMMHVVLQETENERMLDDGDTGPLRQLYYRELIARFGHHLALTWNLGEENGPANFSPNGQTSDQQIAMAHFFAMHDPYHHPVVIHTHSTPPQKEEILAPLLGEQALDGLSFQVNRRADVHGEILKWKSLASQAGHPWLIGMDEIGFWHTGVMPDAVNPHHDTLRHEVLWGSLMAGAAGVEWYFGARYAHNDLNCEDWRSRENMWQQTAIARQFFQEHLPYWDMVNADSLVTPSGSYCLALPGKIYAVYLPKAFPHPAKLDLPAGEGRYSVQWYDPRNGGSLREGNIREIPGGNATGLGNPPEAADTDWVILVRKE